MKRVKLFIASLSVAVLGALAVAPALPVAALDPLEEVCSGSNADSEICQGRSTETQSNLVSTIINTLLFFVGILAVIMIIVGGIMYVTSSGDSGRISQAKNTITYSIVGLVVSVVAYAVVRWVFDIL